MRYNARMKKRKQGRPKLPAKDVRSVRLPLRIKPSEESYLRAEAEKAGVKYTEYLRTRLIPS